MSLLRDVVVRACLLAALLIVSTGLSSGKEWTATEAPLATRWAKRVTPANAWQEYPRPQMKRETWQNLNGLWHYAVTDRTVSEVDDFDGKILVPYPIEAPLSGVGRNTDPDEVIWYRRSINRSRPTDGSRVLLHFEASDWDTTVWINGQNVGHNRGGYDPFTLDITDALKPGGTQQVVVRVWDPQTSVYKASGKQRRGAAYAQCSGLWQTVWLETVPETSTERIEVVPDIDVNTAHVTVHTRGGTGDIRVKLQAFDGEENVSEATGIPGESIALRVPDARLWSPDQPFLYDLKVQLMRDGEPIDEVTSYFGMREISFADAPNRPGKRIFLNGKPIFQMGPLDQNWWPAGSLTPPSDEAMKYEANYLKRIGCNMVRLHIKQNPRRWYYHCDKIGLLVWQDFVNGRGREKLKDWKEQWLTEQRRMMETLQAHPSLVMWVVFNESWGQHDTERVTAWTMEQDKTRLVSAASGWTDVPGLAHIRDIHDYTRHPSIPVPQAEPERAVVLGELGGFNSTVPGNNWVNAEMGDLVMPGEPVFGKGGFAPGGVRFDYNWSGDYFRPTFSPGRAFATHYEALIDDLRVLQAFGLQGGVYTQMTDMRKEQNGYLTFDREVSKAKPEILKRIHERLYESPPSIDPIIPGSQVSPQSWHYTTEDPEGEWQAPGFDDGAWEEGPGPFGNTIQFEPGTLWESPRLYLRKKFTLDSVPEHAVLTVFYFGEVGYNRGGRGVRDDAKFYINGRLVDTSMSRQRQPQRRVEAIVLRPDDIAAMHQGENVLAVLCNDRTPDAPQIIDVALSSVDLDRALSADEALPSARVLLPTSQDEPREWRYCMSEPGAGWMKPDFDASRWTVGIGGFGAGGIVKEKVGTDWTGSDIWIRRGFQLEKEPSGDVKLAIFYDEDATVYINGILAARLEGFVTAYRLEDIRPQVVSSLHTGENTIAVHTRQRRGAQYIDAGLLELCKKNK